MTRDSGREPTLRSLHGLRQEERSQAADNLRVARTELDAAELALASARQKLATFSLAQQRDEVRVNAGALQRREACRVALGAARVEASAAVKVALARVNELRVQESAAEQTLREAHGRQRVVDRALTQLAQDVRRNEERVQNEDNDELAARLR